MRKMFAFILFFMFLIYALPVKVFATDDDSLQIDTETITLREYRGATLTDRYNTNLLTEAGYLNAQTLQGKNMKYKQALLDGMFLKADNMQVTEKSMVQLRAEQANIFGKNYERTIVSTKLEVNTTKPFWIVVLLVAGAAAGFVAAGLFTNQSKNGGER